MCAQRRVSGGREDAMGSFSCIPRRVECIRVRTLVYTGWVSIAFGVGDAGLITIALWLAYMLN